jgi:hypothetical protein
MIPSTVANYKQAAAAELAIAIGHLEAALHLWSPGSGLSPAEHRADGQVQSWHKLKDLVNQVKELAHGEGPGA